jgi:hypothetical protein
MPGGEELGELASWRELRTELAAARDGGVEEEEQVPEEVLLQRAAALHVAKC